jgi:asparagine synthetase B (glutamine-hydrolysing)
VRSVKLLGSTDAVFAWDGRQAYLIEDMIAGAAPPPNLLGMAACVQPLSNGTTRVFRDRLGLGKLFWSRDARDDIVLASRPIQLVRAGCAFDRIASIPRGSTLMLDANGDVLHQAQIQPPRGDERLAGAAIPEIGSEIRRVLDAYLAAIAAAYPGRRVYVCLSRGLDSSTIAVLVKNHFTDVVAVSFDLARASGEESADPGRCAPPRRRPRP